MTAKMFGGKLLASTCLLGLLLWGGVVPAQQDRPSDKGKTGGETKAKDQKGTLRGEKKADDKEKTPSLHVKAIELKHAQPEQLRQTLTAIWGPLMAARGGMRTAPRMPGPGQFHMVANARNHTLFVRGTEKELATIEELVKVLDAGDNEDYPESKEFAVVRLKHAKVPEVMQVLVGLSLQSHVIPLPNKNALVVLHAGKDDGEIRTVIDNLDQPDKKKKEAGKNNNAPAKK